MPTPSSGRTVLSVGGDRTGPTRVYAHQDPATKKVGVVVINLDSESQAVDLQVGPANGTMTSTSFWAIFRALLSSTAPHTVATVRDVCYALRCAQAYLMPIGA